MSTKKSPKSITTKSSDQDKVGITDKTILSQKNVADARGSDMFILGDVRETEHVANPEYLAELKRIGWVNWSHYESQKSIDFTISRTSPADEHDGNNLTRYVNCIRRYINSRNENLVLDFIPNHEQKMSEPIVYESGDPCLINEIRTALNGVLCRQIRGNIYELHAINSTPGRMNVMTGHITRADSKSDDSWHGDFAPTIKLGQIEPGSELHIKMIYMRAGRVFTDELPVITGSEVKMPPDNTYFLHNGFTKYDQPDIVDTKNNKLLRNPMISAAKTITLGIYPQPYLEPRDIVIRALEQLTEDLNLLLNLATQGASAVKSAGIVADSVSSGGVADSVSSGVYSSVRMSITTSLTDSGDRELLARIHGFDESIGIIIASNAGYLEPAKCMHNSAYMDNITMKATVIRITTMNSSDPVDLLMRAINLAVVRTVDLVVQFRGR